MLHCSFAAAADASEWCPLSRGGTMAEPSRVKKQDTDNKSIRTGLSEESIRLAFLDNLFYVQGRFLEVASPNDKFKALAYTIRDRLLHRWVATVRTYQQVNPRTVCYFFGRISAAPIPATT
jgi:starch phosphorylase